jgi:hypothetical protein
VRGAAGNGGPFDLWAHQWMRRQARGEMIVVRYGDDFVVGFQHRDDAALNRPGFDGGRVHRTGGRPSAGTTASGASQQYYDVYLAKQDTNQLDNLATDAVFDTTASTLQLKGQTYPHAVAIDLNTHGSSPVTESYQLPIPGFKRFSSPIVGLDTNASAKASYKLTVYKNNDNPGATVLYTATFNGPSDTHPMSFNTHVATDLVFDWSEPSSGEPDNSDQFIMANPVVTS